MSKVTMPEPFGYARDGRHDGGLVFQHKISEIETLIYSTIPLYSPDQMEAYAVAKALEWQPIETAPKDGTWVRLWREPESIGKASPEIIGTYDAPTEYMSDGVWMWPTDMYDPYTERGRQLALEDIKNGDFYEDDSFTHWMPLPDPPVK